MADAQDLARRYLALWQEYLAALLTDRGGEMWWAALWRAPPHDPSPDEDGAEFDESDAEAAPRPPADAAPAAGASHRGDELVAELARRLADLEGRLAAVERRAAPARSRARNRRVRG